jgi:hypothetical protein
VASGFSRTLALGRRVVVTVAVVAPDRQTCGVVDRVDGGPAKAGDQQSFVAEMGRHQIACAPVQDQGYGLITQVTLPGGGKLGGYQARHARPPKGETR